MDEEFVQTYLGKLQLYIHLVKPKPALIHSASSIPISRSDHLYPDNSIKKMGCQINDIPSFTGKKR